MIETINWADFSRIVYINLAHRRDRNVHMKRQLRELNAPKEKVIRFEAIAATPGAVGCVKSHIAVLEMAIAEGWEDILIMEDDFEFTRDGQSIARLNAWLKTLGAINWDVALLAANYQHVTPLKSVDYLLRINRAWCACAYRVNRHYFSALRENFRQSLALLEQGHDPQQAALDVHWWHLMMKDCWLGLYPCAGFQFPDKSDIEKTRVDYRPLFFKSLDMIS
ncbi:glycosyltransferase family 25 protein [Lelliottia sp. V89_10]|uniref:glycosyltransferase family 25 protein n=1 Tax=Lelliottia wanjuensis TaxID=3050585 RepID=UPI00249DE226|nr:MULTISPECIES: glycosyltransferase family 25 protein [unclassified Lelliottia]MDI3362352.1 glycosyltransferase family 25 protein [Lelliottia sp. V89_13]MDK9551391.1 glycosyltransferase family 25 protein [Lelliottia sp. V89_5]MDK9596776.1 glycosyltransferase family 25 protein [Lelliottia sp. V89_10]